MEEIAEQTRSKVLAARKSKRRAAELLDAAKHAVEIAIESDEATALEFLKTTSLPCSPGSAVDAVALSGLR